MFHEVFTPEKSVVLGGHFYLENALHLTEWTRWATNKVLGAGTNTYHAGTVRVFARMVMAVAHRGERESKSHLVTTLGAVSRILRHKLVLRRPFIAMARMFLQRSVYSLSDHVKDDDSDPDPLHAETEREAWVAQELIMAILKHNNLDTTEICDEKRFPWYDEAIPWYSPGGLLSGLDPETVQIPPSLGATLKELIAKP